MFNLPKKSTSHLPQLPKNTMNTPESLSWISFFTLFTTKIFFIYIYFYLPAVSTAWFACTMVAALDRTSSGDSPPSILFFYLRKGIRGLSKKKKRWRLINNYTTSRALIELKNRKIATGCGIYVVLTKSAIQNIRVSTKILQLECFQFSKKREKTRPSHTQTHI